VLHASSSTFVVELVVKWRESLVSHPSDSCGSVEYDVQKIDGSPATDGCLSSFVCSASWIDGALFASADKCVAIEGCARFFRTFQASFHSGKWTEVRSTATFAAEVLAEARGTQSGEVLRRCRQARTEKDGAGALAQPEVLPPLWCKVQLAGCRKMCIDTTLSCHDQPPWATLVMMEREQEMSHFCERLGQRPSPIRVTARQTLADRQTSGARDVTFITSTRQKFFRQGVHDGGRTPQRRTCAGTSEILSRMVLRPLAARAHKVASLHWFLGPGDETQLHV